MMTVAAGTLIPNQIIDARFIPDKKLLRAGLLMLLFMTAAFGAATWNVMQDLSIHVRAIPVVLFVIVCVLVALLFAKVDQIAAMQRTRTLESVLASQIAELAKVSPETRSKIWHYWDENGTGKQTIEHVKNTFGVPQNLVQHLLEHYDVRWREQVASLYADNPQNEYTSAAGLDTKQIAEDSLRLESGLPIYPVVGVWLCSDCRKRPCHCNLVTWND